MSEASAVPLFTFKTRTNTELGAESISVADDGSIVFEGILKQVTESMLTSYPRTQLGTWTPNRLALRFDRDEAASRGAKKFDSGDELDLDQLIALGS